MSNDGKTINVCISMRTYQEVIDMLPANLSINMLINKLLKAWTQEKSSRNIDKDTKEERRIALIKSAKETVINKKAIKIKPISVQVTEHVNLVRNGKGCKT